MAILDPNGVKIGGGSGGAQPNSVPELVSQIANRAPAEIGGGVGAAAGMAVSGVLSSPEALAAIKNCRLPSIPNRDLLLSAAQGSPEVCGKAFKMSGGALAALLKAIKTAASIIP